MGAEGVMYVVLTRAVDILRTAGLVSLLDGRAGLGGDTTTLNGFDICKYCKHL